MKIGLINIQRCDSHGAVLLAYALEKTLTEMGHQPYNLDYKYAGRFTEKNPLKRILLKIRLIVKKKLHFTYANKTILSKSLKEEYDKQSENFVKFRKNYLKLTKEITNPADEIINSFDGFVVGSDVVWKPEIVTCEDKEFYFLKTAPKSSVKVAYAASIGTDDKDVLDSVSSYYEGAFDSFDYLSVREPSMIPFVKKYTDKPVVSTIDPVFLLEKDDYREIENNSLNHIANTPYVYVYILGNNPIAIEEANKIAQEKGWSILLDINDGFENSNKITVNAESVISAGPSEFLFNIRNAKYVITDSFHATAFSILFNIEFCVFNRGAISVRMIDLISKFGLINRQYNGNICFDDISWDIVNKQIQVEKDFGIEYLRKAFECKNNEIGG